MRPEPAGDGGSPPAGPRRRPPTGRCQPRSSRLAGDCAAGIRLPRRKAGPWSRCAPRRPARSRPRRQLRPSHCARR
ncbi:MAG: hypothetical protein DLM54_07830 [Acidimicrobiales bacterium]|nr:MAG: hypothetical protein DLM54_07830 [Acidimicrobiales bacterium]